ncbi:MAG: hypothetical protein Q9208_001116 [Pyrenodesmia sp. 3 TL-2023]
MFPSSFLSFSIIPLLVCHSLAAPAGPSLESADGNIILLRPDAADVDKPWTTWTLPSNETDAVSDDTSLGAPHPPKDTLWPQTTGGHYYIRFRHPGKSIEPDDGKSVLLKAADDVDGWIASARKGGYTPVEAEHSWKAQSSRVILSIAPAAEGYLLADLKYYIALMTAFHTSHDANFWEWDAVLATRGKYLGTLHKRGTAKLRAW